MAYSQLTLADLGTSVDELKEFHQNYQSFFETSYAAEWSLKYLHSTFVCDKRRNIAFVARAVPGGNSMNMQHFITHALWADQPIINQLQRDTYDLIFSADEGALIIDESGFPFHRERFCRGRSPVLWGFGQSRQLSGRRLRKPMPIPLKPH